jgi:hypothetical protein
VRLGHGLCYYCGCGCGCDFDLLLDNSSSDKVHQHKMLLRVDNRSH